MKYIITPSLRQTVQTFREFSVFNIRLSQLNSTTSELWKIL